jgi:hypothetical protein
MFLYKSAGAKSVGDGPAAHGESEPRLPAPPRPACQARAVARKSAVVLALALPVLVLGTPCQLALAAAGHNQPKKEAEPAVEAGDHGAAPEMHGLGEAAQLHIVHMAGRSRSMTQHIVMEFLLAAVGVHTAEKLRDLEEAREHCRRIIAGLRKGDERLALPGTKNPEILDDLSKVDTLWARFESAVGDSIAAGEVSADQVRAVADLSGPLAVALGGMVDAFEYYAYGGRTFSVLGRTVAAVERQNARVHQMAKEYLLIAYGHEVERNKIRLSESAAMFERTLKGLVSGDPELRLLPAPSAELQVQYKVVRNIWGEFLPLIKAAAKDGHAEPEIADGVAHKAANLAAAVGEAAELYHQL